MSIEFEDCVRIDDNIYMIDRNINLLYRMNITNGDIKIASSMPEENILAPRLGSKIIHNNGNLYFAPMNAKKIWKWNISSGKWTGFERKYIRNWTDQGDMFQAIQYNNKIFFIGCLYPAIIILDLDSEKLTYLEEPYQHINPKAEEEKDACFRTDYVQIENTIYIASCVSNEVLKLNMDSYEYEFISVGESDYKYSGICFDGNKFYLSPRKTSPIVIWDGDKEYSAIELPDMYKKKADRPVFAGAVYDEGRIVLPARFWDKTIILNKEGNSITTKVEDKSYSFYKKLDVETYAFFERPNCFCIKDRRNEYKYNTYIEKDVVCDYIRNNKNMVSTEEIYSENDRIDLKIFLSMIA